MISSLIQSVTSGGYLVKQSPIKNITVISQETTPDASSSENDGPPDKDLISDENAGLEKIDDQKELQVNICSFVKQISINFYKI